MSVREALAVWDLADPFRNDAMLDSIMVAAGDLATIQEAVDIQALKEELSAYHNAEPRDEWPQLAALAERFLATVK